MEKKQYGLPTAIAMIVGIVIGSGIFFRSDNILAGTGGSITLGVLVFVLAAISIIFGSLSIAELASRSDKAGGIITYAEDTWGKRIACALGWFHTFLYYPTLTAVVGWVAGIYITILFEIEGGLGTQVLIGLAAILVLWTCNVLSTRLGGYMQNASTVIKLIPLFVIAVLGLTKGTTSHIDMTHVTQMASTGWIAAIAPVAFAFDGWIISTSIGHELKDSKKNLPLALIIAPIFILIIYVLYFVGISIYIGPEQVIALGDEHVYVAANQLFGPTGGKIILTFVVISILGTVNGLLIGLTRLPYSLAIRNLFPQSEKIATISEKYNLSIPSAVVGLALTLIWLAIHYFTQVSGILGGSDISEISITINYVLYILLYYKVFELGRKGEIKGIWKSVLNPLFATLGSIMILVGSLGNALFWHYTAICVVVLVLAFLFASKQTSND